MLERVDHSGSIHEIGTYADLMAKGDSFEVLMERFGLTDNGSEGEEEGEEEGEADMALVRLSDAGAGAGGASRKRSVSSASTGRGRRRSRAASSAAKAKDAASVAQQAKNKHLMQKEERMVGAVKSAVSLSPGRFDACRMALISSHSLSRSLVPPSSVNQVYKNYIVAGGAALIVVALIFYCIGQVSSLAQGFIVAVWTQAVPDQHGWYMLAFALNAIIMALIAFIRTFTLVSHSVRASIKLHNRLLNRIMRAPVSFFDTTPVGTGC